MVIIKGSSENLVAKTLFSSRRVRAKGPEEKKGGESVSYVSGTVCGRGSQKAAEVRSLYSHLIIVFRSLEVRWVGFASSLLEIATVREPADL